MESGYRLPHSDQSPDLTARSGEAGSEGVRTPRTEPADETNERQQQPAQPLSSAPPSRWGIASGAWHVAATLPLALVVFIAGATLLLAMAMLLGHWLTDDTTTVTDFQWAYGDANTSQSGATTPTLAVTSADLTSGQALASTFADTLISNLEDVRELAGRASDDRYWGGYPAMAAPSAVSPLSYQRLGSVGAAGIQIPAGDMLLAIQQLMPFGHPSTLSGTIVEYWGAGSKTDPCPPLLSEALATPATDTSASSAQAASQSAALGAPIICVSAHLAGRNGIQHAWSVRCEPTDSPRCDGQSAEVQLRTLAKKLSVRVAYDYAHDKTSEYPAPGFQSFGAFLDALAGLKRYERTGLEPDYTYAVGRLIAAQASTVSVPTSSSYVQFVQGRLYEQAAYYRWADGVIGLVPGEPLGINSNEAAFVTPSCSPLQADRRCRAQNSVLAFGASVCDEVFENVQLHPDTSGLHVGCIIPNREQAYGQLGLADIALDEYRGLAQLCRQAEASYQLGLATDHLATANSDIEGLKQGPGVATIRAMRAKVLEEQAALAERIGADPVPSRRDALVQWQRVTDTKDLGDQDRADAELHIDALERFQLADDFRTFRASRSPAAAIVEAKRLSYDGLSLIAGGPSAWLPRLFQTGLPPDYGVGLSPQCSTATN